MRGGMGFSSCCVESISHPTQENLEAFGEGKQELALLRAQRIEVTGTDGAQERLAGLFKVPKLLGQRGLMLLFNLSGRARRCALIEDFEGKMQDGLRFASRTLTE